ncbi:LytTR family DNA-binding domain-containing protein [Magnetospirillum aberrantis]|uniref:PAS domain-containing protein n=1 Tax=Magnetospirillum aberrantis SpK TaxID=908842 RepID=A0A7C9URU7_9PROT|nr:LytTR family DNA-binding domain-containing protein [Magnetospirillum aberrantis]NFV78848.1 PAS domain-containing protein [Magnetospirillum aberrantis SpK]
MSSFEYRLQRSPVGVLQVDSDRTVVAANPLARRLLEPVAGPILGRELLSIHPEAARAKVQWMLDAASARPDEPVGMAMTLPMGALISRVTTLETVNGPGWCLVFHLPENFGQSGAPASDDVLVKLPVGSRAGVTLIDVASVMYLEAEGHYTRVHTADGQRFCQLSFAELVRRLDPAGFLRVHRSYIVNLRHAEAIERGDGHWAIIMTGRARVPVSRARVELVRRRLAL